LIDLPEWPMPVSADISLVDWGAFLTPGLGGPVQRVTPNYVFREGQPFSILTGGKHHLYFVATETIASNSGTATLALTTMLRRPHADNDEVHVGKPMIEGFITGDELSWNIGVERLVSLAFDITESQ
jgi:hypothetical protein